MIRKCLLQFSNGTVGAPVIRNLFARDNAVEFASTNRAAYADGKVRPNASVPRAPRVSGSSDQAASAQNYRELQSGPTDSRNLSRYDDYRIDLLRIMSLSSAEEQL